MDRSANSRVDVAAIRQQTDRIRASPIFFSAQRSQDFLRYVVERSLAGAAPKEYEIAVEVMERGSDYDPATDATVRVEAGRLRGRLREYYQTAGKADLIFIDIPKGGYAAVFTPRETEPEGSLARTVSAAAATAITTSVVTPELSQVELPSIGKSRPPAKVGGTRLWAALIAAAAMMVALAAWAIVQRHAAQPIRSLAVLPLDNLSADAGQEYFADGMTDELITELARIHGLRVVSRTSVMREKGLHRSLRQIADDLSVDAIVEGSIVRAGDRIRITAQLIDTRIDKHLWAQSFEGRSSDVLALQDRVANEIASQTKVVLTPAPHGPRDSARSIDPAAYDAYLHGRFFFQRQDMLRSADSFQQALAIEPSYASAYAGLADALDAQTTFGQVRPEDAFPKALAAAKHAIELDPENGEAYTDLGSIQTIYQWDWQAAQQNLTRGIALGPGNSVAEMKYSVYLDAVGRPEEAVTHMRRALTLDPLSFFINRRLGVTLYLARHYDEALDQLRRADNIEPNQHSSIDNYMSKAYEQKGMHDEAVEHDLAALQSSSLQIDTARLRSVYESQGWNAYWEARISVLLPNADQECMPYEIGVSYLRLRDVDRAFAAFDRAVEQHCYSVSLLRADPQLDSIRNDLRYRRLLQRVNLANK